MRLFRQRSLTVEAVQFDGTNEDEIDSFRGYPARMDVSEWLVRDVDGQFKYLTDNEMTARFEPVARV